jgi:hypothetical protein
LGVGMMVDSSIVVLENIFRRRKRTAKAPEEAAVEGAREVGPAIVASTITTLVIFLPLIFVRGVSGILFKEMAYVIIFALVCSLTCRTEPGAHAGLPAPDNISTIAHGPSAPRTTGPGLPGLFSSGIETPTWICCVGSWITASSPSWLGGCPARGQPTAPAFDRQ